MSFRVDESNKIDHAKAYPFGRWEGSYLLIEGEVRPFVQHYRHGRTPVLASGSNAAPNRLKQKFPDGGIIPVESAKLHDFDAVYSAHITTYGAIPATLFPASGVTVELFVTWLSDDQLEVMHATEAVGVNYDFLTLESLRLDLDYGSLSEAHAYISRRGALNHQGQPIALEAVTAHGRTHPTMTQEQVLCVVRDRIKPGHDLDTFIHEHIMDESERQKRTDTLKQDAHLGNFTTD